jgi:hypothetical protein
MATALPESLAAKSGVEAKLVSPRYKTYFLAVFVAMTGFA